MYHPLHPLYTKVYNTLVESMKIIVGDTPVDYLPPALRANRNNEDRCPIPPEQRNAPQADSNVTRIVVLPEKVRTPVVRFKNVRQLTGKIEDYAKNNMQIYEMVGLRSIFDNCVILHGSSSNAKGAASRLSAGDISIPQIPQRSVTTNADNINMANQSSRKRRKKTSSSDGASRMGHNGGGERQQDDMATAANAHSQGVGWGEVHAGCGGEQDDMVMEHAAAHAHYGEAQQQQFGLGEVHAGRSEKGGIIFFELPECPLSSPLTAKNILPRQKSGKNGKIFFAAAEYFAVRGDDFCR